MKIMFVALAALAIQTAGAHAATIVNKDGQDYSLQITEGGEQSELGIQAGQTISVCASGCFITMPNGDRETLSGAETVEIVNGKANIK
jgi:hypothetical protein